MVYNILIELMLRFLSIRISLYVDCHKCEIVCGAVVLIVTVACMNSSRIHMSGVKVP